MKKIHIFLLLLIVCLVSSCEENKVSPEVDKHNEQSGDPGTIKGKIVKIDEYGLHVQHDDRVDVYNVDSQIKDVLYLGQYVVINKLDGEKFDAVIDTSHDYNVIFTPNGKLVERISGTVGEISQDIVTIITETEDIKLKKTGDFDLNTGEQLIVDYVKLTDANQMIDFYDEASKINVTVKDIYREYDGMMVIDAVSENNKEYTIMVKADTLTNFLHSTLKAKDRLVVYPYDISNDEPAVIDAKLIIISNKEESASKEALFY